MDDRMAPVTITRLGPDDLRWMHQLLTVFSEAFDDPESYDSARPDDNYLLDLLSSPGFFAVVAIEAEQVVAGLAAYELRKFEQQRSELYIYDLAVAESHRRRRIATALIERLGREAAAIGAWVVYVQADYGDEPAIALYQKLGTREDVMHFDIPVTQVSDV
jgi:aminoglycoside 3-N-acetyltransferase I